jgi:hypothetical protein
MVLQQAHALQTGGTGRGMKGYDALECTLISRGYAGKHLGHLSELSFLTDTVAPLARFLFEFHADDYKSLGLPVIPPFASNGTIYKILKTNHVCIRKTSKYFYFVFFVSKFI